MDGPAREGPVLGVALLLGLWSGTPAAAQGTGALAVRTVHGKVEMINPSVNAVAVIADDGHRMAWQFDEKVMEKLKAFNAVAGGSSRRVGRFRMLTTPPSLDAGEITDKGYVNQRATQDSRAAEVASLFTAEAGPGVVQL